MYPNHFSPWQCWAARETMSSLHLPGIYALVISDRDLSGQDFSWLPQIVYFGMTNSRSGLKGRLKQFDKTINGKSGHGGADRFRHDFPIVDHLKPSLFVSVLPFACDVRSIKPADLEIMGAVAKAEYDCFAHFSRLFARLPKYNDKSNAPKAPKAPLAT